MKYMTKTVVITLITVYLTGCNNAPTEKNMGNQTVTVQSPALSSSNPPKNESLAMIKHATDLGAGTLTKENSSIGNIHLGDTQEQVKNVLGSPTSTQNGGGGTPEVQWFYEKENTYILFYRNSEIGPIGGVTLIRITGPSQLKNEKGIAIGDPAEKILSSYKSIGQASNNYWISGRTLNDGFYTPLLHFGMDKKGFISSMQLTTEGADPAKTE